MILNEIREDRFNPTQYLKYNLYFWSKNSIALERIPTVKGIFFNYV